MPCLPRSPVLARACLAWSPDSAYACLTRTPVYACLIQSYIAIYAAGENSLAQSEGRHSVPRPVSPVHPERRSVISGSIHSVCRSPSEPSQMKRVAFSSPESGSPGSQSRVGPKLYSPRQSCSHRGQFTKELTLLSPSALPYERSAS